VQDLGRFLLLRRGSTAAAQQESIRAHEARPHVRPNWSEPPVRLAADSFTLTDQGHAVLETLMTRAATRER